MNTMKRAHEIRREAAEKWSCRTSEIIFSICLEIAWTEKKENKMKGSDKQVAWAEKIKAKLLAEITKINAKQYIKTEDLNQDEFSMDLLEMFIEKLNTSNDAGWFIEKARHASFYTFEVDEDDDGGIEDVKNFLEL